MTTTQIVDFSEPFAQASGFTFRGIAVGGTPVCFIFDRSQPGEGPALHRHPYDELWLLEEGTASFTAGQRRLDAGPGQVVVVAAGTPHKFVNTGDRPLRMVCIHTQAQMETEWLPDPDTPEASE